ncbi:FmdB family zinc ribbon protein [Prauserella muralis]|uniref:FmdB family zinc ribbon protein n=1 Tax=Prauserella muralis TaxID=588067 RepID=UPI000DD36CAD|nr:FmdB family zinc ribbon protein [Prauserella muralis]
MPTYQYACKECDHQFEVVQSFSDPSLTECPECHGRLRKLFGSVGVIFKGSGFYRTDSRSDKKSSSSSASSNGSAKSEDSSAKSDSSSSTTSSSSGSSDSGSSSTSSTSSTTASAAAS